MGNTDLFKEQYFKEIDRATDISNSFSTPIGIKSAMIAGLYYSFGTFGITSQECFLTIVFLLIVCVTAFFLIKSIYHLIKAIANFKKGYDYYLIPNAEELARYCEELKSYNAQTGGGNMEKPSPPIIRVQNVSKNPERQRENLKLEFYEKKDWKDFEEYILGVLAVCITKNQKNNDIKLYQRFLCIRYLTVAILTMLLLIFPIQFREESPSQEIKIEVPKSSVIKVAPDL